MVVRSMYSLLKLRESEGWLCQIPAVDLGEVAYFLCASISSRMKKE